MGYRTISIPEELYSEIEGILGVLGYRSVAEFVKEAIREKLREMKKQVYPRREDNSGEKQEVVEK